MYAHCGVRSTARPRPMMMMMASGEGEGECVQPLTELATPYLPQGQTYVTRWSGHGLAMCDGYVTPRDVYDRPAAADEAGGRSGQVAGKVGVCVCAQR